ncbi:hypothetical protein [Gandjariella thermophila]|uniref:Lipoprotein n=1 Tax=Gandjariella thermophila TaxID=1931992 RepID=A0A4D4JBD5_9PSEU|nr:hypothetical protein [Gandjariella thermophila]GDY31277.1 hypothetical protein GTS_29100 [Gandjariella thermophila]
MRRTAVLVCGVIAALALAACGAKTESGTPVAAGGSAGSARGAATFGTVADLASAVATSSRSKQSAHFSTEVTTAQGTMKGTGVYRQDASGVSAQYTMSTPQGEMQMIVVPNAVYLKMARLAPVTGGKPWIKVTPDGTDPMSRALGGLLTAMQEQADVTKAIDRIKAAGTITNTTRETVDGVSTTHYTIKVDMAKLAEVEPDPNLKQMYQAAIQQGLRTSDDDVWLNGDNLPVKFETSSAVNGQQVHGTASYTQWGEPVQITVPPADQVGQFPTR